jgi:PAS domain S-box-containing protein
MQIRSKSIFSIIVVATLAVTVLPLYTFFYLHPTFASFLIKQTESEAARVASHLALSLHLTSSDDFVEKSKLPDNFSEHIMDIIRDFKLMKLKVFDKQGKIVFSTSQKDIGKINKKDYFHNIVAKGNVFTKIVKKDSKSLEDQVVTLDVVETYVPIMQGNIFVGAFEVYYDITEREQRLSKLITWSTITIFSLAVILFLGVIISSRKTTDVLEKLKNEILVREKISQNLSEQKAQLQTILDTIQTGIAVIDPETCIVEETNQALSQLIKLPKHILIGTSYEQYLCLNKGCIPSLPKAEGRIDRTEGELVDKDGNKIPVEKLGVPIIFSGKKLLMECYADISERKKAIELRDDVERITRHDLKSPLNGVIGFSSLLLKESSELTSDQQEMIKLIEQSGFKMLNMINRSLDMYKMEQGIYTCNKQKVDLLPVLQRVLTDLENLLILKEIEVLFTVNKERIAESSVFMIETEELLIYSLFANLIKNAIEASSTGQQLIIALFDQEECRIEIHNKGVVPAEIRKDFFKKYTTAGKVGGTGLGTYSARLITETLGGNISMDSNDNTGTVICIIFPKTE